MLFLLAYFLAYFILKIALQTSTKYYKLLHK
nr:MAG TPA: hypothetical protein [Caudoviricetes sp.]